MYLVTYHFPRLFSQKKFKGRFDINNQGLTNQLFV